MLVYVSEDARAGEPDARPAADGPTRDGDGA